MKKKSSRKKTFDCVKFFRKIKTEISRETYGMTYEQVKAYYDAVPKIFPRK